MLPKSTRYFFIDNLNNYGYALLQVHSFHYNLTITTKDHIHENIIQNGTRFGFLINSSSDTQNVYEIWNNNLEEVYGMIALIGYSYDANIPRCSMEDDQMLHGTEVNNFLIVKVPPSKDCEDSELSYETYYTYIDTLDFTPEAYFDAIEMMMFQRIFKAYKTKSVPTTDIHLFETIPGRGLVVNTAVRKSNGELAFYIPFVTYSCPQNSWLSHCTESSLIKRGIATLLVIHSIVMILNLTLPEFIESILNGMLFGGFGTIVFMKSYAIEMQTFDYFIILIVGSFLMAALFGTIGLYISLGRYLTKFTFSSLIVIFIMEGFFSDFSSVFIQLFLTVILSCLLSLTSITCSVFLGFLMLILNISYLIRVANLHRLVVNNFLALTTIPPYASETLFQFKRPNYINYRISLNINDCVMILLYIICSIYVTMRKQKYFFEHPAVQSDRIFSPMDDVNTFNCEVARRRRDQCIIGIRRINQNTNYRLVSRCRRHLHFNQTRINERTPIISHWLTDVESDVFWTPPQIPLNLNHLIRIQPPTDSSDDFGSIENFEQL